MKLNADVIYDNLSQSIILESHGRIKKELTLKRPEFYNGAGREFKSNQIYISLVDRLPTDPVFGNGTLIICVGGNPHVTYLTGKCVCFLIKDNTDLFTMFNLVQQIFDKYDEWDAGLQTILNTTASIKELIELSFPIIENPMVVIDSNYHYLAYSSIIDSRDDLALYRPDKNGNFELNTLSEGISYGWTNLTINKPFLVTAKNVQHISINLFEKNVYAGNLTVPFILRQQRQSDIALTQHLAQIIENSFTRYSTILSSQVNMLKGIFKDLLNGFPVNSTRMQYLESGTIDGHYSCIKIELGYRAQSIIPVRYICNHIETTFAGCVAFEYESVIVTFIDSKKIPYDEITLTEMVKKLLREMDLKAGVSYPFSNLTMARLYYRQASVALEMGSAINPELSYYPFHDYVLSYMISQCMGEFPLEPLLTEGIGQLLDRDSVSQTNYVMTLRTYLNNNMNITKTAKDLFIHRSTLLERLKRIENLLQTDLGDPDQRLRLLISLKIIEANARTTAKPDSGELINSNSSRNGSAGSEEMQILESIYQ